MNKTEFNLKKINTKQFAIIETSYDGSGDKTTLEMGFSFGINAEILAIVSMVKFQFKQKNKPFLLIEVSCEFEIEAQKWNSFLQKSKKGILFPKDVIIHLATITVGISRGILHSKTENTEFNQFILPTINLNEVITEGSEFVI
jgi:hypothetical protein